MIPIRQGEGEEHLNNKQMQIDPKLTPKNFSHLA